MEKRNNFALVAIFLLTLVFFGFILNLYFSQDDFFHLKVSQTGGSLREFIELFSFRSFEDRGGIYFYRPIFREGLFNIFGTLFGLNPIPFRILQFIIHLVNIFLVYKLVFRITQNKIVSNISSLVFGISSANIGVLTYLAGGIQASGMTMFLLLSMINFPRRKPLAFSFFLLALASHELAVIYPALFLNKKTFAQSIKNILPYLIIVAIYLFLQIKVIGLPTGETEYGLNFSLSKIINSYVWYFAWGLGIPEMLLDFVGPGANLNPNLMMYWGNYFRAIFPLFGLILIGLIVAMKRLVRNKQVWLFVYWFIVGISPVAILPLHRSTYYLAPVLPAIGAVMGFVFYETYVHKKTLAFYLFQFLRFYLF